MVQDAHAHALVVVAISAGPEVDAEIDRLWKDGRPDEAMFLNAYAIAATENLRQLETSRLAGLAERQGFAVLPHYSPGYEGWELADQRTLYEIIVAPDASPCELPGCLDLLPSGALRPTKSTLAAFGITLSSLLGVTSGAAAGGLLQDYWYHRGTASRTGCSCARGGQNRKCCVALQAPHSTLREREAC